MNGNDLALLEQWRNRRDPEAFRELVEHYAGMVHGTCRRILGDAAEAEDVAQECFAILACGTHPPERHLGAWLHRVATNLSRNHARTQGRRRAREQRYADATPVHTGPKWDDIADLVDELIAALPDNLRVPLVAHFLEGQSQEAIARTLGVTRPAVSHRIARGVARIRKQLKKRGVVTGPAALASLLAANAAEAAPHTLVASLGKMAITGACGTVAASTLAAAGLGTAPGTTGLAGLLFSAKGAVVAAAVLLGAGAVWLGAERARSVPAESVAPAITAETADPAPVPPPSVPQAAGAVPGPAPAPAAAPAPETAASAWLSGVVVDAAGRPVRDRDDAGEGGLAVSLYRAAAEREVCVGGVGFLAEGTFAVRDLSAFSPDTERVGVGARRASTGEVSEIAWFPRSSGPHRDVVLRLLPGGSISGTLMDRSGRSLGRQQVDLTAQGPSEVFRCESDDSGVFHAGGLRPGAYELVVSGLYYGKSTRVELANGQHLNDVALTIPVDHFRIAGHVLDRAGKPIPGVNLWVYSHSALCEPDGSFNETVPQEGSYPVAAFSEDYALVSQSVEANTTDLAIILGEPSGLVQGRVVDAQGEPVPQFRIERDIAPPDRYVGGSKEYSFNNADGTFEVKVPIPGQVRLIVEAAQHEPQTVVIDDFKPPRRMTGLTVQLADPGALSGVVQGTDGTPLADVAIVQGDLRVGPVDANAPVLARTGPDGRFSIEAAKAGVESLVAQHPGYLPESVYTRYDHVRSQPLSIVLARAATVEGTVRRANQPVAGATVEVTVRPSELEGRPSVQRVTTDGAGRYLATPLKAGEVGVSIGEGGVSAPERTERKAMVREGETVVVDLDLPDLTAALQGRVSVGGAPLPPDESLYVALTHRAGDQESTLRPAQLESDGAYRFSAAPAGDGVLRVSVGRADVPDGGGHLRLLEIPVRLVARRTETRDVDLVPADAVLEGKVLPEDDPPERIQFRIAVQTATGAEQLGQWEEKCREGGFRVESLPAGDTTVSMVVYLASGRIVRHELRCETRSGQVARQDVVLEAAE